MLRKALDVLEDVGLIETIDLEPPYDAEDELEIRRQLYESWDLDQDLLKIYDKISTAFGAIFSLCEKNKLLKGYIGKDTKLADRALALFLKPDWLAIGDIKTIKALRYWAGAIRWNRPNAIKNALRGPVQPPEKKESKRLKKRREFDKARRHDEARHWGQSQVSERVRTSNEVEDDVQTVEGSILGVPPLPAGGEEYLRQLTSDGEDVLLKVRNIHKRLGKRKDCKELARLLDPNQSMNYEGEKVPYQAPEAPKHFVTGYA